MHRSLGFLVILGWALFMVFAVMDSQTEKPDDPKNTSQLLNVIESDITRRSGRIAENVTALDVAEMISQALSYEKDIPDTKNITIKPVNKRIYPTESRQVNVHIRNRTYVMYEGKESYKENWAEIWIGMVDSQGDRYNTVIFRGGVLSSKDPYQESIDKERREEEKEKAREIRNAEPRIDGE